ncbi:sterol O-acyltransferase 1-like [Musca vetustissima]|uniref:sterol O-acyltransferase 1-like n=1 Tax=Musca vetustissima TaxID=27455 RepID=UPI002AB7375B|nr:sterol O-acyltransferase 1-like [Musca vetustissima]
METTKDAATRKNESEHTHTEINISQEVPPSNGITNDRKDFVKISDDSKKMQQNTCKLPKRHLECRESYFTELMKNDHIRCVYNLFIVAFIFYLAYNIMDDYFVKGRITLAANTFREGFINIHYALGMWLILQLYACAIYYPVKIWANIRAKLHKHDFLQSLWSLTWLLAYITSQGLFVYVPAKVSLEYNIRNASCFGLLFDTMRLVMKQHAFVRVICGRVVSGKSPTTTCPIQQGNSTRENNLDDPEIPRFPKYLYYLFAPTLLYRDNYPRTSQIRWKFAVGHFIECLAFVFLFAFLYENHLLPILEDYGKEKITGEILIRTFFKINLTIVLMFLSFVYFLLHSWNNFTGELLKFGYRKFHSDWWLSKDYLQFFHKWNNLVGDWLYEYIYRDMYMYGF